MSGIDIAIIVIVSVLFAAALGFLIYRKLKGKSGCDCGGSCAACGLCNKRESDGNGNKEQCACRLDKIENSK